MSTSKLLQIITDLKLYTLSLGIFITILIYIPSLTTSYNLPKLLILYSTTCLLLLFHAIRISLRPQIELKRVDLILLLVFLNNFLSFIASDNSQLSWWGEYPQQGGGFISVLCYIVIIFTFSRLQSVNKFIVLCFVVGGTTLASIYAFKEFMQFGVRPSGLEGQPILSASIIALGVFCTFVLLFHLKIYVSNSIRIGIISLLLLIHLLALYALESYTVFVAFVGASIVLYGLISFRKFYHRHYLIPLLVGMVIIGLSIPFLVQKKSFSISQRFLEHKTAIQMITREWQSKTALRNIIIGHGQNTSVLYSRQYKLVESYQNKEWLWRISRIRDTYLEFLFTTGLIGITVWAGMILYALKKGIEKKEYVFLFVFLYLIIWQASYFLLPLYFIATLIVAQLLIESSHPKNLRLSPLLRGIGICLLLIGAFYFSFNTYRLALGEYLFSTGRRVQAISVVPENTVYKKAHADLIFERLRQYREDHPCIKQRACFLNSLYSLYEEGSTFLMKAIKQNPRDSESMYSLSSYYFFRHLDTPNDKKYLSTAHTYIDKTLILDPNNPELYDSKGTFYLESGEYLLAEKYLKKSLEIKPDLLSSQNHLKEVYRQYKK